MMDKLRSSVGKGVWNIVFVLISVSFVLGGIGTYLSGSVDTSVAKVNGEKISYATFQNLLQQQTRSMSAQMGEQFYRLMDSPEFAASLRKDVVNNLIDEMLLQQFVNELGLAVSDEQIKRFIVTMPDFQKEGKFDNALYQQFLYANNLSADYYAMSLRGSIIMNQLQKGLFSTNVLSEKQLSELSQVLYQTRKVLLTELPLDRVEAEQQVTQQEIEQYYNDHKSAFTQPDMVKVAYVDIAKPDIEKGIQVSDIEVAQYYQDHKSELAQARTHLAHIQVATEEKANEIYQLLNNGEDFARLAQAHSIDKLSAVKGGDLSWSKADTYPAVFEQAADNTEVGQITAPVKVDNTYHIIKVLAREDGVPPLEQVRAHIIDTIRSDLASATFYRVEKEASEKAFEDQASLGAVESVVGKKAVVTEFFSRQDVPTALNFPNVIYNIFDTDILQGGENSEAINVGEQHSIVVRVLEYKPAGMRSLEEVTPEITAFLKREKAQNAIFSQASDIAGALNRGEQVALPEGVTLSEQVSEFVYVEMQDRTLRDALFAITKPQENKPIFAVVRDNSGKLYLANLIDVAQGKIDEKQMQLIAQAYSQGEQIQAYRRLIQALRSQAKIEINEELIAQQQ